MNKKIYVVSGERTKNPFFANKSRLIITVLIAALLINALVLILRLNDNDKYSYYYTNSNMKECIESNDYPSLKYMIYRGIAKGELKQEYKEKYEPICMYFESAYLYKLSLLDNDEKYTEKYKSFMNEALVYVVDVMDKSSETIEGIDRINDVLNIE